jgi:Flp pilus assembly protein TadB
MTGANRDERSREEPGVLSEDRSERQRARTGANRDERSREEPGVLSEDRGPAPTPGQTLGAMWLYTVLRFGLFLALWGLLWLARVPGLLAGTIAVVLSIPLSYILLRKQRARLAANLEARVAARQAHRHNLDTQLSGEPEEQ